MVAPVFGSLYWSCTWRQLSCFCNSAPESIDHLFFECPLAQSVLSWLQFLMFRWSLLAPSLAVRHIRFGFSPDELSCVPKVFVYILNVCNFFPVASP